MPTVQSWEVSDALWSRIEPLLPQRNTRVKQRRKFRRRPGGGRKPISPREVFAAIVFVLRTGCQWKALPKTFGSASAIHHHFQQWREEGFFMRLWRAGLAEYDEMEGIAWEWLWEIIQQIGEKKGTKRSLLVDGRGAPLSLIVAGANQHDVKLLAQTLDAIVIRRPKPTKRHPQNLCVDKGYVGKPADRQIRERGYIPHVPGVLKPKARFKTKGRARRWVVERTHSWMNNYRKLRVRYEKKVANFEALLHLATAIFCWRM